MGVQDTHVPVPDPPAGRKRQREPQTPEAFEGFHRWLYRGALFFFVALIVDAFVIFPFILIKFGWQ